MTRIPELKKIPKLVLLVEDDLSLASVQKRKLSQIGCSVRIACSFSMARELLEAGELPDMILMDLDLGEGPDGVETARELAKHWNIPTLFLSSHSYSEIRRRTLGQGAYGCLEKNCDTWVLLQTMELAYSLFLERSKNQESAPVSSKDHRVYKPQILTGNSLQTMQNSISILINLFEIHISHARQAEFKKKNEYFLASLKIINLFSTWLKSQDTTVQITQSLRQYLVSLSEFYSPKGFQIHMNFDECSMPPHIAMTLTIAVGELVIQSFQNASPGDTTNSIHMELLNHGQEGIGMQVRFSEAPPSVFVQDNQGLHLVKTLVHLANGTFNSVFSENCYSCHMFFPSSVETCDNKPYRHGWLGDQSGMVSKCF